jgi:hypothetical protein
LDIESLYQQLFFTTFYVETFRDNKTWTGTGLFFSYTKGNLAVPMLVTNRHVVEGFDDGAVRFILSEDGKTPKLGQSITLNIPRFQSRWHTHPDLNIDIAVMPFAPVLRQLEQQGRKIFYRNMDTALLPTEEQIRQLNAIEDVIFIGYPKGIFDTKNLLPIARRGITATPVQVDYNDLPAFLIDASVFPGSSGSPVLIANEGGYSTRAGFNIGSRAFFLGVVARVHFSIEKGHIVIEDRPTADFAERPAAHVPVPLTQQLLNLGVVFKARTVIETIEDFLRLHDPSLLEADESTSGIDSPEEHVADPDKNQSSA